MSMKKSGLVALSVLVVLTTILLTGCPDLKDIKPDAPQSGEEQAAQGDYPDAPEGGGLRPTLVQYALLNEMINFTAAPGRESPNGDYDYTWEASYEGMPTSTVGNPGYVFDVIDAMSGVGDTKFEEEQGWCTIHFTKAAEWTVTVRIIGASGTDEEVICGVYSAIVNVRSMRIEPSEITNGEVGKAYTFTAEAVGSSLPEGNYTYEWRIYYLGDAPLGSESKGLIIRAATTSTNYIRYFPWDIGNFEIWVNVTAGGKTLVGKSWLTITHGGLSITVPDESPLVTNTDYTFIAESTFAAESLYHQYLPEDLYYHWDFGDETGLVVPFFNEVTHNFTEDGQHTITVEVRESEEADAPLLASATVDLTIEPAANHLVELHQMKKFELDFFVQHDYVEGMSGIYVWGYESYGEVVWDGVNFSMEWEQYNHSERMTGRVSEDGTTILQLKMRHEYRDSQGNLDWWGEIEIQNLPFWIDPMPDRFVVDKWDEDVQNYVVYFNTSRTAGYQWTDDARLYVQFTQQQS